MNGCLPRLVAGALLPLFLVAAQTPALAEDVTIDATTPGLQVWNRTSNVANVPVRVGRTTEVERAYVFAPVCTAMPCETNLARGAHVLGLSRDGEPILESDEAVHIEGPTTVKAEYHDRTALRVAGWGLFVVGLTAGIILLTLGAQKGAEGSSHSIDPVYGGLGAGAGLAGLIGGLPLAFQTDSATFSVAPLVSLGATGKRGEPAGEGNGLALRVRF